MRKELCSNCNAKMTQPVSFCPVCARPTPHASGTELLEWDLGQWRRHVDRSVASSGRAAPTVAPRSVAVAQRPEPYAQEASPVVRKPAMKEPERVERSPKRKKAPRAERAPKVKKPRRRLAKLHVRLPSIRSSHQEDRVIVLDADHEFVYTSCTSCERADWILRTGRNEDETYKYWCIRCSRGFKSDARLRHGLKPFIAAGSVISTLAMLSVVMR